MMSSPLMTEYRVNPLMAVVSSLALCAPAPAFAQGRFIMVANCLGGMNRIDLPSDPKKPSGQKCCHAANDRRKKGQQSEDSRC
jgi:hypothetical protein